MPRTHRFRNDVGFSDVDDDLLMPLQLSQQSRGAVVSSGGHGGKSGATGKSSGRVVRASGATGKSSGGHGGKSGATGKSSGGHGGKSGATGKRSGMSSGTSGASGKRSGMAGGTSDGTGARSGQAGGVSGSRGRTSAPHAGRPKEPAHDRPSIRVNGVDRRLVPHHLLGPSDDPRVLQIAATGDPPPTLPPRKSLRAQCPPVLDQDPVGSCAAFAFTSALRFLHHRDGQYERLSPLFCYWISRVLAGDHPYRDSGCKSAAVVAALEKYGVCLESAWPYDPDRFTVQPPEAAFHDAARRKLKRAFRVTTLRAIKLSIVQGYPVPFYFPLARSVNDRDDGHPSAAWKSGRFPLPSASDPVAGYHFVLAIGYDDKAHHVEVENSWGPGFGTRGYGFLDYAFFGPTQDTPIADREVLAGDPWTLRAEADEPRPV